MRRTGPIRVLHCIDTLDRGGAETLLLDLWSCTNEQELELHVLASGGGSLESAFRAHGARFTRRDRTQAVDRGLMRFIREYCVSHDIDIVHGHQPVSTLHALIALRSAKLPVVHSIHGFTEDLKNKLVFRYVVTKTVANILVSAAMEGMLLDNEWIRRLPHARVVYNGVDPHRLKCPAPTLRQELGLPADAIVLGMTGNFYGVKDQLTLCRAMIEVVARDPRIHCVFAGRPDDPIQYQECVDLVHTNGLDEHVHFLGGRADVPNILHSLDLFVFSTRADTFGLSLVEAMMVGVPCVVSDIDVMREVTQNGALAALFPFGDATALASTIIATLRSAETVTRSENAQHFAHQHYSVEAHQKALTGVYSEFVTNDSFKDLSEKRRYIGPVASTTYNA